ncbi:conserved Plasmodium protein, unknown function [Plasmodium ovale]|uniref:Uncharacterized protein n=1 Tax=Plasmodium ovale TaxID=36330 RepID=A0A1C3KXM8_PLAOA|nr:conserved Plasmodium protein, unknown function [Plasmodium ovale]
MKTKKRFFLLLDKRYYNPPSKRKWSKQNEKYKTRRPLAENLNVHKINIKGEYWKQKHVNKQFVVENANQDMINEKTSLNFFGYPNISLHNKLGGSLYIEQMDQITLCVIMNKCIKENIYESHIWKSLLNRCTRIAHKMNGSVLSYIFKYASLCAYYHHYFFLTMLGNISSNLYSLNIKNCSNILYAMNNNSNFYNEDTYNKIIEHCSLLILSRNDIDINSVLSIVNSFYPFNGDGRRGNSGDSGDSRHSGCNGGVASKSTYLLFDSISKTFDRYDLELTDPDMVCSTLLVYCTLDKINLFFQEKNKNVIKKIVNYLHIHIEKLNIKHITILCFTSYIFKLWENLNWNYVCEKIEKDCYLLEKDYLSFLFYSLKGKLMKGKKSIHKIIYNNLLSVINDASLDSISLITHAFLKYPLRRYNNCMHRNDTDKGEDIEQQSTNEEVEERNNDNIPESEKLEIKVTHSFDLFSDFLFGKIKYNIGNFTSFQMYLIFKGLHETRLRNDKVEQLKNICIKEINKNIYSIPVYLLSYISKIVTKNGIKDSEIIKSLKDISLIYLNIYKEINISDSDYTINENSSLIDEYYKNVSNQEKGIKSDLTFLYNEKKKEINFLSEKYIINQNLFLKKFKHLNDHFGITKKQIEKILHFSKNIFFNYYLKEKQLANFIYFSTVLDKKIALTYFNEIREIIEKKMMQKQLKFTPVHILYIFKALDFFNLMQKKNTFFSVLLKQLCDELFSIRIAIFFEILQLFYKNGISHYYFLKKAKCIVNMNRYELSQNSLMTIKKIILELSRSL